MRPRPIRAAMAALVLAGSVITTAVPAHAATVACGSTVTTRVVLTEDLVCTTDPGLVLGAGAVLDLGGHTLRGPGRATTTTGLLVATGTDGTGATGRTATVTNGTVAGWGTGLTDSFTGVAVDLTLDGATFDDNGTGAAVLDARTAVGASRFTDNDTGMEVLGGPGVTVTGSRFAGNGLGLTVGPGAHASVTRTTFTDNTTGIFLDIITATDVDRVTITGSRTGIAMGTSAGFPADIALTRSTLSRNDVGLQGQGTLTGNTFHRNGVGVSTQFSTTLRGNRFHANGTGVHASEGFFSFLDVVGDTYVRNGDGLLVDGRGRVGDVRAYRNSGWGIHAPQVQDLGGNVADRNGNEPQCVGVVCTER